MLIVLPALFVFFAFIALWVLFNAFGDNVANRINKEEERFQKTSKKIDEINRRYENEE